MLDPLYNILAKYLFPNIIQHLHEHFTGLCVPTAVPVGHFMIFELSLRTAKPIKKIRRKRTVSIWKRPSHCMVLVDQRVKENTLYLDR